MKSPQKVSMLSLVLMLFSSCIVPPSTYVKPTFHLLNDSTSEKNESARQGAVFAENNQTVEGQSFYLRQIELPYYLQENRIITRPENGKIEFRENDRWGEPLIEGIGRVSGLNLSKSLNSPFYSVYPHREKIGTQWYPRVGNVISSAGVGPYNAGRKEDGSPITEVEVKAYYQWVPFMLFLQGVMFYVPHIIYKAVEGQKLKVSLQKLLQFSIFISNVSLHHKKSYYHYL